MAVREIISDDLIAEVRQRLASNKRVRRTLPEGGRIHIDRQLPFLCIYRQPEDQEDKGTSGLVTGEASYIVASAKRRHHAQLSKLVQEVVAELHRLFGAVLVVEVWAKPEPGQETDPRAVEVQPTFEVSAPGANRLDSTVEMLVRHLKKIRVLRQTVSVEVARAGRTRPPGMRMLLPKQVTNGFTYSKVGIAVPPVYRDGSDGGELLHFPLLLRTFRRKFSLALRRSFFEFASRQTSIQPPHFHVLGRRAVVRAVWDVDAKLAQISNQFDYLLNVTPINTHEAWNEFKRSRFQRAPEFHYLPLPFDPYRLKRKLFDIRVERVEDPALATIFREKQDELDRKITMLRDRNTFRFLPGSLQLFGNIGPDLVRLAEDILKQIRNRRSRGKSRQVDAKEFAAAAEDEFRYYRKIDPDFKAKAVVTTKVAGVMVSRGQLLVSTDTTVPEDRVDALLQHEVGTHLLTYYNGMSQPFKQLYSGLAGYEELQEGLAVLAEYLVDGLSSFRIRQLAGRVIAARMVLNGASFVETFHALDKTWDFNQKTAYNITMRVYRGGGLTKDAVYLRGFQRIVEYVRKGGDLNPLFVGKMAENHIPVIRELQHRKVLKAAPVKPRFMERPAVTARLQELRESRVPLVDIIQRST